MQTQLQVLEFVPLSLKRKPISILLLEIKEKNIGWIWDVRRKVTPFNSAQCYYRDIFKQNLELNKIGFTRFKQLGNLRYVTSPTEYLTDEVRKFLKGVFWQIFGDSSWQMRYGIVCYCTEEAQADNQCHASWLANYLNDKLKMVSNTD